MRCKHLLYFALLLGFVGCTSTAERQRMLQSMELVDSMNRNYISLVGDTLMPVVTLWMDRHGSPNERVRAHYLQAAVYRDCGQVPEALEELQVAAQCADTMASDCDFRLLSRVHGQMAELLLFQYLPQKALQADSLCHAYAEKANDTFMWLVSYEFQSKCYIMEGESDSAIAVLENVFSQYHKYGFTNEAANCIEMLPLYLAEQGRLREACRYMDVFESQSRFYDPSSGIAQHPLYYYVKGKVALSLSQVDSAISSFRKLVVSTENPHELEMAYKGLYLAYMVKNQSDSVAKYATLCYESCDENFQKASIERLSHMQANYDYSCYQKKSQEKERETSQMRQLLIVIVFSGLVLIILLLYSLYVYRLNRKHLIAELTSEYEHRIELLQKAEAEFQHNENVENKRKELDLERKKLQNFLGLDKLPESKAVNLFDNEVYQIFRDASNHPDVKIEESDWQKLSALFDEKIPHFRDMLTHGKSISEKDYRLCMLIRMKFGVLEICTLMDTYSQYVSVRRRRLLEKLFNIEGKPEDFDRILMLIV